MSEEIFIQLTMLDCEYWKAGQCIMKISEEEYNFHNIDFKKRFNKRKPEYWIYVDSPIMLKGEQLITVQVIPNKGMNNYKLCNVPDREELYPQQSLLPRASCFPHFFKCCPELKILYCEKCGETRKCDL